MEEEAAAGAKEEKEEKKKKGKAAKGPKRNPPRGQGAAGAEQLALGALEVRALHVLHHGDTWVWWG